MLFWKKEKRDSFRQDLASLRNGLEIAISKCQSDRLTDSRYSLIYENMIEACYKALSALYTEDIDGVTKANNILDLARNGYCDYLDSEYRFSLRMENRYYDDY